MKDFQKGSVLIWVLIIVIVIAGGLYIYSRGKNSTVSNSAATAIVQLGGGYSKDNSAVYFAPDSLSTPKQIQGADLSSFNVFDASNSLAKDNQHMYSFGELLVDADYKTFVAVGTQTGFYKDATHVWIMGGKGELALIPGADAKTFVVTGQNSGAKDANHTYSFDAKGYLYIDNKPTGL
jgi:hypothetical protein